MTVVRRFNKNTSQTSVYTVYIKILLSILILNLFVMVLIHVMVLILEGIKVEINTKLCHLNITKMFKIRYDK